MGTYTCECCGKVLEDWPALAFKTPDTYYWLSNEDKAKSTLTDDFCVVNREGEIYRFIRAVMFMKVIDSCQELQYGLWVSLSEASFNDYDEHFRGDENYKESYFGWISNDIPEYDDFRSIPTTVVPQKDGIRPYIFPHQSFDHPLVADFYNGITKEEAEARLSG